MKITRIETDDSTKPALKQEPEGWKEWFMVKACTRYIVQGQQFPRWYLPVRRDFTSDQMECWIFPLAPFVLVFLITYNIFWSLWNDTRDFLYYLQSKNKK